MRQFRVLACVSALLIVLSAGTVVAAPQIILDGSPTPVSAGVWQFNYKVTNYGSADPINDIEVDASACYGWIDMGGPPNWTLQYPITGPLARWSTEASPVDVESEKYGFWVRAGTPDFYYGGAQFTTGADHHVFATGTMAMPLPEPASMLVLGTGLAGLVGTIMRRRR